MTIALLPFLGLTLFAADAEKTTLRYVKPAGEKFVLESEVTTITDNDGHTYISKTTHGAETLTLTIRYDKKGQVVVAEAVLEKNKTTKSATVTFAPNEPPLVKRGGITDLPKAKPDAIVTTAPEWNEVFQLVQRYDAKKGGKQEFTGLWFHPELAPLTPTFTIEHVGTDKVTPKDKPVTLERYKVTLKSSDYMVWADTDGRVCKVLPKGEKAVPVVLEGFEEATKELK
jgi:hypothetical protein